MEIICRKAKLAVLNRVVGKSTPIFCAAGPFVAKVAARLVAVNRIGEGRNEHTYIGCLCALWRTNDEGQDFPILCRPKTRAVEAGLQPLWHCEAEIRLPFAIFDIVFVKMDRGISFRRVLPAHLGPGPVRSFHCARRRIVDFAVQSKRPHIDDTLRRNFLSEVPMACHTVF